MPPRSNICTSRQPKARSSSRTWSLARVGIAGQEHDVITGDALRVHHHLVVHGVECLDHIGLRVGLLDAQGQRVLGRRRPTPGSRRPAVRARWPRRATPCRAGSPPRRPPERPRTRCRRGVHDQASAGSRVGERASGDAVPTGKRRQTLRLRGPGADEDVVAHLGGTAGKGLTDGSRPEDPQRHARLDPGQPVVADLLLGAESGQHGRRRGLLQFLAQQRNGHLELTGDVADRPRTAWVEPICPRMVTG